MNKVLPYQTSAASDELQKRACSNKLKLSLFVLSIPLVTLLLWLLVLWGIGSYRVMSDDPAVWQSSIDALMQQKPVNFNDTSQSNEPVIFVGSSSIRLFQQLESIFSSETVLRRGFGGAKINDVAYYKQDLILNHDPKLVVFYIGVNDLLYSDYQYVREPAEKLFRLISELRSKLPQTPMVLLAQRPTSYQDVNTTISEYNEQVRRYALSSYGVYYIDPNDALMSDSRELNDIYMHWDGLHLSSEGYLAWGNEIHDQLAQINLIQ
ncbi:MAG: GDSL-type esterase/lipase family protein [Pseudomonadales bacterium]|nr:GDSL-type esterase/lipase family protein [Pseudomonadales bacterium]